MHRRKGTLTIIRLKFARLKFQGRRSLVINNTQRPIISILQCCVCAFRSSRCQTIFSISQHRLDGLFLRVVCPLRNSALFSHFFFTPTILMVLLKVRSYRFDTRHLPNCDKQPKEEYESNQLPKLVKFVFDFDKTPWEFIARIGPVVWYLICTRTLCSRVLDIWENLNFQHLNCRAIFVHLQLHYHRWTLGVDLRESSVKLCSLEIRVLQKSDWPADS